MKNNKAIFFLSVCCIISSCQSNDLVGTVVDESKTVFVSVSIESENHSRSLDSESDYYIDDVNIYFYHKTVSGFNYHTFSGSILTELPLIEGDYDIYVITNYGSDIGYKSQSQIANMTFTEELSQSIIHSRKRILMSKNTVATIIASEDDKVILEPIIVDRAVAFIDCKIDCDPEEKNNWTIHSIQYCNIPSVSNIFEPERTDNISKNFYTGPIQTITLPYSHSFYMLENKQGITNHTVKNRFNSPEYASYLEIKAQYIKGTIQRDVSFRVYFGQNQVNDYNLKRNGRYTFDCELTTPTVGEVGDIYYSDHTTSKNLIGNKTPIGIVATSNLVVANTSFYGTPGIAFTYRDGEYDLSIPYFETAELAINDMDGYNNTVTLEKIRQLSSRYDVGNLPCEMVLKYTTEGTVPGQWFLPAAGQVQQMIDNLEVIESTWKKLGWADTFRPKYFGSSSWSGYSFSHHWYYIGDWTSNNGSSWHRPVMEF